MLVVEMKIGTNTSENHGVVSTKAKLHTPCDSAIPLQQEGAHMATTNMNKNAFPFVYNR